MIDAVGKLSTNKSAGATGLKALYLKGWVHHQARPTDPELEPDPADAVELSWGKVLEIGVRLAPCVEGVIPKTFAERIFVLIPKSDAGECHAGIVLLEILYKVLSSIVNSCLLDKIEFDDLLHGNNLPSWEQVLPSWGPSFWPNCDAGLMHLSSSWCL